MPTAATPWVPSPLEFDVSRLDNHMKFWCIPGTAPHHQGRDALMPIHPDLKCLICLVPLLLYSQLRFQATMKGAASSMQEQSPTHSSRQSTFTVCTPTCRSPYFVRSCTDLPLLSPTCPSCIVSNSLQSSWIQLRHGFIVSGFISLLIVWMFQRVCQISYVCNPLCHRLLRRSYLPGFGNSRYRYTL